jgi:UTP--glucose-1-phosphate uridylyltransferase
MSIDLAVIPVAGLGTRLLPATKSQPKEMLPVGRKPVVQYIVEEMLGVGMRRVLFITGPGKTSIENHFDLNQELIQNLREHGKESLLAELEFERAPLQYFYTRQRQLLGLGHAILCAEPFAAGSPFVVALGDSIIGVNKRSSVVQTMLECYEKQRAEAVVVFEEVPPHEVTHYGIAKPKTRGSVFELEDVIEKPTESEAPSNLAIAARYVLSPRIFQVLRATAPGKGGEIQLTDALRTIIKQGGKIYGVVLPANERRYDIGHFDSYYAAFLEFALADEKYGPKLRQYLEDLA